MSKRLSLAAALIAATLLLVANGCGLGSSVKVNSVDDLDAAIHPKEVPVVEEPAKKPAAKVASGGGGGEPFALEKASASIKGVVAFEGTPPKVIAIPVDSDKGCVKCRAENNMHLLVKEEFAVKDGKFANVIVYVSDGFNKFNFENFSLPPARINQFGCQYTPHVLAMMTDQKLEIQSSDDVAHNIHASPQVNNGLNVSQTTKGIMPTRPSFAAPEMGIPVRCDVHSWMNASICVFEHPFFAVTGEDGSFEIKLPPGKYELSTWQESAGKLKSPKPQKIEVVAGTPKEVKFVYAPK